MPADARREVKDGWQAEVSTEMARTGAQSERLACNRGVEHAERFEEATTHTHTKATPGRTPTTTTNHPHPHPQKNPCPTMWVVWS